MKPIPNPTHLKMNEKPAGIAQANRLPFIVIVSLFILIIILLMIRADNKKQSTDKAAAQPIKTQTMQKEDSAKWFDDQKFKEKKLNFVESVKKPLNPEEVVKQTISEKDLTYKQQVIDQDYLTKIELVKLKNKQLLDEKVLEYEAQKASLDIEIKANPVSGHTQAIDNEESLNNTYQNGAPGLVGVPTAEDKDFNKQSEKQAFLNAGVTNGEYLTNLKKKPISPFEIKAGTYIPAALITGINSDLPGSIVAQVTENVYDTVSGNYKLIPQGSKLVGEYDSRVSFGQNRALVVWTRLIFPDGATLNLEKMAGVDISGYGGFKDKVNNHYMRIYGNALLLSLMGAGYDILNSRKGQNDAKESVAASVGQRLAEVSGRSMDNNMNVQPTIIINPGYKFKVMVVKDVILEDLNDASS